jgi:hypothetical protein
MAEYIERTDAMNAVLVGDVDKDFPCMDIAARLHDIPAADVRPVVRGRWIEYPEVLKLADALNDEYIGCPACGNVWNMMDNDVERFNYCPNCGADMREER